MHTGWSVLVSGNQIEAVGLITTTPANTTVIDLPGATILPGLIEGHAHLFLHPYNETSWDEQVLNESRVYGSVIDSPHDVDSFSIFFRPGIGREVAGALERSVDHALDDGAQYSAPFEFDEALRPHDGFVTPVLRSMQRQIRRGERDEHWLEERC
jgi:imidazolonepropionase-like amidohydrolase